MAKFLIFVIFFAGLCSAQSVADVEEPEESTEVSLWAQDGSQLAPWLFYKGKKFTFEERYNWDDKGVLGACLGKSFGSEALNFIPEICGYTGKYNGYGPELWVNSDTKKFFLSSYVQYAKMRRTSSYGYMWFQADYKFTEHIGVGPGAQALKDGKLPINADAGLSIVFRTKKFYVNFLPLWKVTSDGRGTFTNYAGVGYVF